MTTKSNLTLLVESALCGSRTKIRQKSTSEGEADPNARHKCEASCTGLDGGGVEPIKGCGPWICDISGVLEINVQVVEL